MTYADQLLEMSKQVPDLATQIATLRNLEAILKWAPRAGVPFSQIDLLQQDEYSYDLYLQLPDSRWITFGVT